jgi:hypothetical protein
MGQTRLISKGPLAESGHDLGEDIIDGADTHDRLHDAFFVVVVDEGGRLGVVNVEPLLDRCFLVVVTLEQRTAAS